MLGSLSVLGEHLPSDFSVLIFASINYFFCYPVFLFLLRCFFVSRTVLLLLAYSCTKGENGWPASVLAWCVRAGVSITSRLVDEYHGQVFFVSLSVFPSKIYVSFPPLCCFTYITVSFGGLCFFCNPVCLFLLRCFFVSRTVLLLLPYSCTKGENGCLESVLAWCVRAWVLRLW